MKFAHADVQDGTLLAIKNGATRMLLVSAYAAGDSYATVQANKLCEMVMAPADYTISSSATSRVLSVASGKQAALTAAATGSDAHLVFTDGAARVLWVTDETGNPTGAVGAIYTFPAPTFTCPQPA